MSEQIELQNNAIMTIDAINMRITSEICHNSILEMTDGKLLCKYINSESVKNKIKILGNILDKYENEETKQKIIQDYILELIPAGTKGVIRGNKFNYIVKEFIIKISLDTGRFDICFEKKCSNHYTSEIPDWYIYEKNTNKIIIGMNQLDLISGGAQINRGYKYLINNIHNNEYCKLLCVICSNIQFKSKQNKAYKLFEVGFENNTLCYLNNLQNIINSYFTIMD